MMVSIKGVQPGDVLAVRTTGWAAAMIRFGAALRGEPNLENHVAVAHHYDASGTLWCVEGRPDGVGWRNAAGYLASPWTLSTVGQVKTAEQRRLITVTMMAMLGMAYDWGAIAGDALGDLHLWNPVNGQVNGHVVCSSLAAHGYDAAKLARPAGGERAVQPADWTQWMLTRGWDTPPGVSVVS